MGFVLLRFSASLWGPTNRYMKSYGLTNFSTFQINAFTILYIQYGLSSSVYSPFSDNVGLPPHNTPLPGVLMKSIGAAFLRPDALPDVNHIIIIIINEAYTPRI